MASAAIIARGSYSGPHIFTPRKFNASGWMGHHIVENGGRNLDAMFAL